jgi:hypothetical protein
MRLTGAADETPLATETRPRVSSTEVFLSFVRRGQVGLIRLAVLSFVLGDALLACGEVGVNEALLVGDCRHESNSRHALSVHTTT